MLFRCRRNVLAFGGRAMRFVLIVSIVATSTLVLPPQQSGFVDAAQSVTPIQLHGINYNNRQGPDWDPNRCKNTSQVFTELSLLSKMTNRVRVLSCSDCLQGPVVLNAAKQLGMQLWFGLWVSNDTSIFQQELTCLKQIVNQFDSTVLGVSVGSEAIYRKDITANQSIAYFQATQQVLSNAGRDDLPVAICEVDDTYVANPQLFRVTDIVLANSFPFWEKIDVADAAQYMVEDKLTGGWDVASQYGKEFILGETGWASQGYSNESSVASPANQAQYFQDFYCLADRSYGWKYYWFLGFDTDWRLQSQYENSVEGSFGIFFSNLTMKPDFVDLQFSCSGSNEVYGFVMDATPSNNTTNSRNVTSMPVASSTTTDSPATSPAMQTSGSCAANSQCHQLGLVGDCCPTEDKIYLICCDDAPTLSPDSSSIPREVPTVSPRPSTATTSGVAPTTTNTTGTAPTVSSSNNGTKPTATTTEPVGRTTAAPTAGDVVVVPPTTVPQLEPTATPVQGIAGSDVPSDVPSTIPTQSNANVNDDSTSRPTFVVDSGSPPSPFDSTRDSTSGAVHSQTRTSSSIGFLLGIVTLWGWCSYHI